MIQIHSQLTAPVICGPPDKGTGISISLYVPVLFDHKIQIPSAMLPDTILKLRQYRDVIFKRDYIILHIIAIDFQQAFCILCFYIPDCNITRVLSSSLWLCAKNKGRFIPAL